MHMSCIFFAKNYSWAYIPCIKYDLNKKALAKLISSLLCFLKIYTADKNFTRPLVTLVAPNINSDLAWTAVSWERMEVVCDLIMSGD